MHTPLLSTFQLVNRDKVISPVLTTIREYGVWFEKTFDEYTVQKEIYLKSKKKSGESVLEWHPGTRIGQWFDNKQINSQEYQAWYILQDSPMMERLVKLKLAEQKDAIPISSTDDEGRRMIRVYTVAQINLYLKNLIDKSFDISTYVSTPKQIKVRDCDMSKLIVPKIDNTRKKLF